MFKKILIANRGEIACRVAKTARRLGVKTVAVYSDVDSKAKHVAMCDESVGLGGSAPKDSYLRWEKIIEAAKKTGAEAIHPGYGFLSENEDFAKACGDAGLVFIGPPASAIRSMGLKAQSKQLMEAAGVPLVPGYHGADQDPALLQREADRIGYPVLIKASAGGGGKGMRAVDRSEDFAAALASCKREAINSFGDDAVLIEKYVLRPRHIEIQVFGDTQGNYVYLFERDCSVQRRHQKVLEEAPAPGMTRKMREEMGAAAVAAARAVNYVGAGTVEFIVEQRDDEMRFFFMEMNTRLQVEHPVTEAITGLDLVEWQLRVACGEPLPLLQDALRIEGHAIEARVCAENPDNGFLPATGSLNIYRKPEGVSFERGDVRIDDGVREGDEISPFYDSMIAKLIVYGANREQALARLDAALARMHIVGVTTNLQFLRRVIATESFSKAMLDTALIKREEKSLFKIEEISQEVAVSAAIARILDDEKKLESNDPFSKRDGWRSHGSMARTFHFQMAGDAIVAGIETDRAARAMTLCMDDASLDVSFYPAEADSVEWKIGSQKHSAQVYRSKNLISIFTINGSTHLTEIDPLAQAAVSQSDGGRLTAPMPGKIVSFAVAAGDKVSQGQTLAVMEAMKMEHTIASPSDGVVEELMYAPGDQVTEGAELLRLTAAIGAVAK